MFESSRDGQRFKREQSRERRATGSRTGGRAAWSSQAKRQKSIALRIDAVHPQRSFRWRCPDVGSQARRCGGRGVRVVGAGLCVGAANQKQTRRATRRVARCDEFPSCPCLLKFSKCVDRTGELNGQQPGAATALGSPARSSLRRPARHRRGQRSLPPVRGAGGRGAEAKGAARATEAREVPRRPTAQLFPQRRGRVRIRPPPFAVKLSSARVASTAFASARRPGNREASRPRLSAPPPPSFGPPPVRLPRARGPPLSPPPERRNRFGGAACS